jgi:hypothetical protein
VRNNATGCLHIESQLRPSMFIWLELSLMKNSNMDGFDSFCCANVTYAVYSNRTVWLVITGPLLTMLCCKGWKLTPLGEKMIKDNNVCFPSQLWDVSPKVNEMLK